MPANDLVDVANRHALVGDSVQSRAHRGVFQGQPEQLRSVEPVHRGPAVESVAGVSRKPLARAILMSCLTKP